MADEDKKEVEAKEEVAKSAPADVNAALMAVLKALPGSIKSAVTEANAPVLKAVEGLAKALPPKDATFPGGKGPKGVDFQPADETVDDHPSPDAATKPASVQANKPHEGAAGLHSVTKGAKLLTKEDVEGVMAGLLEKALKEQVPALVKASTPEPIYGAPVVTDGMRALAKSPGKTIDEMLTKERELAGGAYSNPDGFAFGWRRLQGGSIAQRNATEIKFKMLGGRAPEVN